MSSPLPTLTSVRAPNTPSTSLFGGLPAPAGEDEIEVEVNAEAVEIIAEVEAPPPFAEEGGPAESEMTWRFDLPQVKLEDVDELDLVE